MPKYKVGQVYKMQKPFTSTGTDAKERYFICLGRSSVFDTPIYLFSCTTTTNKKAYFGKDNVCVEFEYSKDLFTQPCLICLDNLFDNMTESEFEFYDPKFVGGISFEKLREIKRKLELADISPKVKRDIYNSFVLDGIIV